MKANIITDSSVVIDDDGDKTYADTCTLIQPIIRTRDEHSISRRDIDPDALRVLYRLARNDYTAYLVGGGVRDLLLGRMPKDFDISTNARPEQIRSLFRNCILIGRRFRLAHVRYGEKIIETSTFRSTPQSDADPNDPDADLLQRDDNLFGSPQEDALRRDFTVNGLFYDIESFSIIDYVGGMEDLKAQRIRCIGDPCIRFREDPVRMIRAVRFASRLDFTLDSATETAIHKHGEELAKAAPPRLLEEMTRLFAFSSGEKAVRLLHSTGLLRVILPEVADCLDSDKSDCDHFWKRLQALDRGDTVLPNASPSLIFATLLLEPLKLHLARTWDFTDTPRLKFDRIHAFLAPLAFRLRFPRKMVDRIVHIYVNQYRFANPSNRGKRGSFTNFVTQEAFHESLALAEIILTSEGGSQSLLNQWRDLLTERMYKREDNCGRRQPEKRREGNTADSRQPALVKETTKNTPEVEATAEVEVQVDAVTVQPVTEETPGKKMSRSARRRRNKRLRRDELQTSDATPAEDQAENDLTSTDSQAAALAPTPPIVEPVAGVKKEEIAAENIAPTEQKKSSHNRNRRRRRVVKDTPAVENNESTTTGEVTKLETEESQPQQEALPPLTAAAFWTAPDPEPQKQANKAATSKAKDKYRTTRAKHTAAGENSDSGRKAEEPPLRMDRADEADIPMHWLDEI